MPTVKHWISVTPPPADLIRPGGWRDQAACHNHPTLPAATWDDTTTTDDGRRGDKSRAARIAAAIDVCKTCPVRIPCLDDADLRWDEGVRGGVDLRDLRRHRKDAS
jgi:hypothetical protein